MGTLNEYLNKAVVIGKLQGIKRRNAIGNKILSADEEQIIRFIEAMPAADVQPVKRGEWQEIDGHGFEKQFFCTNCRVCCYVPTCMGKPIYEYCPNCGAKMAEDETP